MNVLTANIIVAATLLTGTPAIAQIPPARYKPTPVVQQDTLQQVIDTRTADFEISKDPKNDRVVYKGIFSFAELEQEPTFSWLPAGMDEYHPNADAINYLKKNIKGYSLLVFIGTWCGDSKDLLPRFYKILTETNTSYEHIMMVGMDREKTTTTKQGKKLVKKYKIKLLPTFVIVNADGNEAGRIEEAAGKSVEEDMAEIIRKDKEHN